jgi:hypothetical protein
MCLDVVKKTSRKEVHMTQNQIKYWTLLEEKRHNVATESETNRHNVVDEGETHRANTVREYETMRHNQETERISALEQAETARHNRVYESETKRHNLAYEGETQRHNMQQEALGWANVNLGYANLNETKRHNVIQESISQREVAVKEQQNVLRSQELDETKRHNEQGEKYTHEANMVRMASSSNIAASVWGMAQLAADSGDFDDDPFNTDESGFKTVNPSAAKTYGKQMTYVIGSAPFSANIHTLHGGTTR